MNICGEYEELSLELGIAIGRQRKERRSLPGAASGKGNDSFSATCSVTDVRQDLCFEQTCAEEQLWLVTGRMLTAKQGAAHW